MTTVSHYATDTDEPAWINEDTAQPTAVTRYVSGVDSDLAATTSTTGARVMQLVDLHGDVMATVPIADGATGADWTGLRFTAFDEFGNPLQMAGSGSTTGPPARYGWLGADQRSAQALGGAILMGRRLYLPSTGRFLSVDPAAGGSANAYDYCNADPVNCTDLNGTFAWKKFAGVVAAVASVASMISGPVGMAASPVSVVAYVVAGDKKQAAMAVAGIALAAVGAGAAVAVARAGMAARAAETGVTAGRVAARALPKIERGVYVVKDSETGLPYVGMSKQISVRLAQHVDSGKITQEAANAAKRVAVTGTRRIDLRDCRTEDDSELRRPKDGKCEEPGEQDQLDCPEVLVGPWYLLAPAPSGRVA